MATKLERIGHVNVVIKAISNHGRRFFYYRKMDRVASVLMNASGHIYLIDDYSGLLVYVASKYEWRGFSHGGTLRRLIEELAEYIRTGEKISVEFIGFPGRFEERDIWGYGGTAIQAVLSELKESPVFYWPDAVKIAA